MAINKKDDYKKVVWEIERDIKKKEKKKKKLKIKKAWMQIKPGRLVELYPVKKPLKTPDIFGLTLITIGFIFFLNSIFLETIGFGLFLGSVYLNLRLGTIFTLIGFIFIYLIKITDKPKLSEYIKIDSKKISLILTLWILTIFFVTFEEDLDVFIVLMIIGILTIKEIMESFMNPQLKTRMKYLSYVITIIFFFVVSQRIIYILSG